MEDIREIKQVIKLEEECGGISQAFEEFLFYYRNPPQKQKPKINKEPLMGPYREPLIEEKKKGSNS